MSAMRGEFNSATPVRITGVSQQFGESRVLRGLDLDVEAGETVALLGPSGCGKTTLLRLVAGLARPTGGSIALGDTVVADAARSVFVAPEARGIGMVFQDYALWPHMSVARNVGFPLEMRRIGRADRDRMVAEALELVGLAHLADRQPGTLSGGQQQRVALARAIVARPPVILFDEPLSNLDRELRESLVLDIAALLRRLGMTGLYVTHDHGEAFAIADRIAILQSGELVQLDCPEALVEKPADVSVAQFLKLGMVLEGSIDDGAIVMGGKARIAPPVGWVNGGGRGHLFVPRAALSPSSEEGAALKATARHSAFRGDGYTVQLELASGEVIDIFSPSRLAKGEPVGLAVGWDRARWFPAGPFLS